MGSIGAPPVVFGALAEHPSRRGRVPVGEAPTGAAGAAALPIPIVGSWGEIERVGRSEEMRDQSKPQPLRKNAKLLTSPHV